MNGTLLPLNVESMPKPVVAWRVQPGSQTLFLTCPYFEVLYNGTRGAGKTDALIMDFAQHVDRGYGEQWVGVVFRKSYKQLQEVERKTRRIFHRIFPGAELNMGDFVWKFPGGERLYLRYMERPSDYWNYHGHEYPWIGWEEITSWASGECYHSMKSCCRSGSATG